MAGLLEWTAMHKKQLEHIRHHVEAALSDTNWKGLFTSEIRIETVAHRTRTARHLEIALEALDTELKRCDKKTERRRAKDAKPRKTTSPQRLPYKDD